MALQKIKFQTNIPVEAALKFGEGKLCDSQFGDPQYMFTTVDDRVFFVAEKVAQKIHGLRLKPEEPFEIIKAEKDYGNNRKGIEWQVNRVGFVPGQQPDGTFAVPVAPAAAVSAAATVQAAASQQPRTPSNGNGSKPNGSSGNGHAAPEPEPERQPSRTRLEDALKTVIAAVHATHEYAKTIGYAMPQFTSEDLRTMANTLIIDGQKGGH
jgi:hypothetical protein